jgi:hypothetical protein
VLTGALASLAVEEHATDAIALTSVNVVAVPRGMAGMSPHRTRANPPMRAAEFVRRGVRTDRDRCDRSRNTVQAVMGDQARKAWKS